MTVSYPAPHTVFMPPSTVPIRIWLADIRQSKGLGQDEVDKRTRDLGARVSQSYLSQLERGVKSIEDLGGARADALRRVYDLTPEEWVEHTGLAIVTLETISRPLNAAEKRGWTMPESEPEPEMPDTLLEAIQLYGDKNPELLNPRWQRTLADTDFRDEPETPEDWLAILVKLRKLINPK